MINLKFLQKLFFLLLIGASMYTLQACDEDDDEDLDENYDLYEGKFKPKSDKFAHKEKVAGKKPKGCCGKIYSFISERLV